MLGTVSYQVLHLRNPSSYLLSVLSQTSPRYFWLLFHKNTLLLNFLPNSEDKKYPLSLPLSTRPIISSQEAFKLVKYIFFFLYKTMLTTDHLLILPCIWRWSPEWFHSSPHLVFEMRLRGLLFPELLIPKIGATLIFFQFSGVSPVHLSGPRNLCVCVQVIPVLPDLINLH